MTTEPNRKRLSPITTCHHAAPGLALGLILLFVVGTMALTGCGEEEQQELPFFDFPIEVRATDLNGDPVPGIPVLLDDNVVGLTDADGTFEAELLEQPTKTVRLAVEEIEGYRIADEQPSLETNLQIAPRVDGDGYRGIPVSLRVTFRSTFMDYLTWIDLDCDDDLDDEYCEDVPILLDGEKMVRTDGLGFAHFAFTGIPGDTYTITVDMPEHDPDDDDSVRIEPENRTYELELGPDATVFYIQQEFTDPDAPQTPQWRPRPRPQPQPSPSTSPSSDSGDDGSRIRTIF